MLSELHGVVTWFSICFVLTNLVWLEGAAGIKVCIHRKYYKIDDISIFKYKALIFITFKNQC